VSKETLIQSLPFGRLPSNFLTPGSGPIRLRFDIEMFTVFLAILAGPQRRESSSEGVEQDRRQVHVGFVLKKDLFRSRALGSVMVSPLYPFGSRRTRSIAH
jgi:hypothetical protein